MNQFDNPGPISLQGSLILADPSLKDPNFSRTVLLLTDHETQEGAHGYVLNRPMGKAVGDLLPASKFASLAEVPVFIGGPVGQERLTFAILEWDESERRLVYTTHLAVEAALDLQASGGHIRAFLGYSGWAGGQLERELRQRSWITRRADSDAVSLTDPEGLWSRLLRSMGPLYGLMANLPDDPSMN